MHCSHLRSAARPALLWAEPGSVLRLWWFTLFWMAWRRSWSPADKCCQERGKNGHFSFFPPKVPIHPGSAGLDFFCRWNFDVAWGLTGLKKAGSQLWQRSGQGMWAGTMSLGPTWPKSTQMMPFPSRLMHCNLSVWADTPGAVHYEHLSFRLCSQAPWIQILAPPL